MSALAVVTGASSGIGSQFARQLSNRGFDLILVARNESRLKEVAKVCHSKAEIFVCDLEKESECYRLLDHLKDQKVAMFVNNAGFGNIGLFEESDLKRDLAMIDVNIRAVHILTHGILAQMKKDDKGYILNTASVAGLMPGGPLMATYYATKSYVVSITNAIAAELKDAGSNVHISALCPGPVDTEFNDVAGVRFSMPGISARSCVIQCIRAMKKQKVIIVPNPFIRIGSVIARILPRALVMHILMKGQKAKLEE